MSHLFPRFSSWMHAQGVSFWSVQRPGPWIRSAQVPVLVSCSITIRFRNVSSSPSNTISQDPRFLDIQQNWNLQDKISHLLKTSGLKQTNHLASPVHCINCTGLRVGQWRLERLYRFVHPCLGFEGPSCTLTWVLIRSQRTPKNPEVTKWGTFLDCFR